MGALVVGFVLAAACPPTGQTVVVDSGARALRLCAGGVEEKQYPVAFGSGGLAPLSHRIGWAVTPQGDFRLLPAIPSAKFHTFIPLANPTPARFTAWAIGVHGPTRLTANAGALNVSVDWTLGCIAVASDAIIDEVAQWIAAHRVTTIHVE